MKNIPTSLSHHAEKGYRLQVGYYFTAEGRKAGKVWWFGRIDAGEAEFQANIIRRVFAEACQEGIWTAAATAWAKKLIATQRERYESGLETCVFRLQNAGMLVTATPKAAPAVKAMATPQATPKQITFHGALEAYRDSIKDAPVASNYQKGIGDSIVAIKRYIQDTPLAAVDYGAIEKMTNLFKSRPLSFKKHQGKRAPIAPNTVKRLLQHLRQALKWVNRQRHSGDRFGGWRMPEDAMELFGLDMTKIMSKIERDKAADGPDQITIAEIVDLYHAITCDAHRQWFLLGLFGGQGPKELSTARRSEFDLDNAAFNHRRNKTGVKGGYWLPPELVSLLRDDFVKNKTQPDDLAFRTREKQAIVAAADSSAVSQAFDGWRARCKVAKKPIRPAITFYSLRRYFAHRAAMIGGDSLRDAALAHTAKTVGGRHYSGYRDFAAVADVGRAIHVDLTAAGMFTVATANLQPTPQQHEGIITRDRSWCWRASSR